MYRHATHSSSSSSSRHHHHSHHAYRASHRYTGLARDEAHAAAAAATGMAHAESASASVLLQQQEEEGKRSEAAKKKSFCGCCTRLFASLQSAPTFRERSIHLNGGAAGAALGLDPSSSPLAPGAGASGATCLPPLSSFPPNVVRNQKYHILTFLPHFLYEQFSFFFNFYFLIVALSQFIPVLQIGFLFTYVAPLVFVLVITLAKEAVDDLQRWRRDREANGQRYQRIRRRNAKDMYSSAITSGDTTESVVEDVPSSSIRVGDILVLHSNQRVPADLVLLRTHDKQNGSIFIRTDQLVCFMHQAAMS